MRGIIGAGAYLPYWRLERSAISAFHGGSGRGTRSVASYDEDTTTMGVEAARLALASAGGATDVEALWFSTANPTYLDKTNATIVHAALRLRDDAGAFDLGGAVRSGVGAFITALAAPGTTSLVIASDIVVGLAGSPDESGGGDGAAAFVIGEGDGVVAEFLGRGSSTAEFLDRWRGPGDLRTKSWEERFSQPHYVAAGVAAANSALAAAGVDAGDIDRVVISSRHDRAAAGVIRKLGIESAAVAPSLAGSVGMCGAADVGIATVAALEDLGPGRVLLVVSLADGADAVVLRTTEALGVRPAPDPVAGQLRAANPSLPYSKYLSWRGVLETNPPNRPEPARMSASAAARSSDWKYGFVASRDRSSGAVHMPPARVSFVGGAIDDMEPLPMADARGTVATFTVDRLAYSPSPPVIFAVVDFDGGGRLPMEVCDVTPDDVAVNMRVSMTFRRLNRADGIANYFWKARPLRGGQ